MSKQYLLIAKGACKNGFANYIKFYSIDDYKGKIVNAI